ncbi:nitroreductase/quinone reductase family protein [Amycolatopsis cihanbeyliensis]|uniref:Deazaflavin-dependent oxidoreductase (Nitroreductase family) n=1 Tax=Amycolatopsis cihanbeyliensis TaxID=1128664 RepID=A0A542DD38_AMYCI|nr:nitroreductase/quinone reductase family protein [Amycolatopsis cihanbeyliensis]TQJ00975.1 deazaflavin-dependent oxidoreductase (nitroreductase family) [Amycolatopsis cihanbeyliensis]
MTEEQSTATQDFDFTEFQRQVIAEFRNNGGKVGGMFEGSTLVLLTTVGARSGLRRTTPLGYLEIEGQPVVVASAMGAPRNPAWYHNIRKNPMVTVETGTETYQAMAAVPQGQERDELFAGIVEAEPGFGEYQARTTRVIPVVTLHRVETGADRARGLGDFLVEGHEWLRAELAELRRQVDRPSYGGADPAEPATPDLGQQLRAHCREFCGALVEHHTGEDRGAFPMLAQRFPALAPALTELAAEHETVARLQAEIRRLVEDHVPGEDDPVRLRDELDRLAADLEAHFAYEEKTVVTALNALGPAPDVG